MYRGFPVFVLTVPAMAMTCLAVTFLAEATSNMAVLLIPVLAGVAMTAGIPPELRIVPAVISASCAFMLPVVAAPNTVVYSSGLVTTARMAREGFIFNLMGVVVISSMYYVLYI